jgi:PIN domain nuclease of toxin-antitoxin system
MRLLLDTHTILWALTDDPRLSNTARTEYSFCGQLYFSMVSLWEIGIKLGLKRDDFQLANNWWQVIPETLTRSGVARIDIEPIHCQRVASLQLHHRDPFDRLLIAQALELNAGILSKDSKMDAYGVSRVW